MAKLFASNQQIANIFTSISQIIWHNSPFIQYKQPRLNYNFRQYLEIILVAEKVFQMGIQKTLLQKSYELFVGIQTYTVKFTVADRQFECLETSLVYDSCNAEVASTSILKMSIEDITNMCSITDKLKFDVNKGTKKICFTNNFLRKTVGVFPSLKLQIMQTTLYIRSCLKKDSILPLWTKESISTWETATVAPVS